MPLRQERLRDQPRTAAHVEDPRAWREVSEIHQARKRRGIGLHWGLLELGCLAVEGQGQLLLLCFGHSELNATSTRNQGSRRAKRFHDPGASRRARERAQARTSNLRHALPLASWRGG